MQYVIDIGAHVGWYIDDWADDENTTVFAFEPHPVNAHTLRHKYVEHSNVIILPFAIGADNGTVKLYRADEKDRKPQHMGRSSVNFKNANVDSENFLEVQMIRLSDFIQTMGIEQYRALKIDTEGNEHVILNDLLDNDLINKFDEILFEDHCALFGEKYAYDEDSLRWTLSQQFKGDLNLNKRWAQ